MSEQQVWNNERINQFAWNCSTAMEARRMFDAMVKIRDDYQAALDAAAERERALVAAVSLAYRKHHLGDASIGWDELSDALMTVLCETIGDKAFQELCAQYGNYLGATEWTAPSGRKWKVDLYQGDDEDE